MCLSQPGAQAFSEAHFGGGSGPILLDEVDCSGTELKLLNCKLYSPVGLHSCDHSQDAGVFCQGKANIGLCICKHISSGEVSYFSPWFHSSLVMYHSMPSSSLSSFKSSFWTTCKISNVLSSYSPVLTLVHHYRY